MVKFSNIRFTPEFGRKSFDIKNVLNKMQSFLPSCIATLLVQLHLFHQCCANIPWWLISLLTLLKAVMFHFSYINNMLVIKLIWPNIFSLLIYYIQNLNCVHQNILAFVVSSAPVKTMEKQNWFGTDFSSAKTLPSFLACFHITLLHHLGEKNVRDLQAYRFLSKKK